MSFTTKQNENENEYKHTCTQFFYFDEFLRAVWFLAMFSRILNIRNITVCVKVNSLNYYKTIRKLFAISFFNFKDHYTDPKCVCCFKNVSSLSFRAF